MTGQRFAVCVAPKRDAVEESIASWAGFGLLGGAALVELSDLAGGLEVDCGYAVGSEWRSGRLGAVLAANQCETVSVVVLRPDGVPGSSEVTGLEDRALHTVRSAFAVGQVNVRGVTVSVAEPSARFSAAAFSPMWALHLLADRNIFVDDRSPLVAVTDAEAPAVCAATALLVGGGWVFSPASGGLVDLCDAHGGTLAKPVRLVRPQLRLVLAGRLSAATAAGALPMVSPWPAPPGCKPVNADVIVPTSFSDTVAEACGFRCWSAPGIAEADPNVWKRAKAAIRRLVGPLGELEPHDQVEQALERYVDPPTGAGANDFVEALRRSAMPDLILGPRELGRRSWQTLRSAIYGLADATGVPEGVDALPALKTDSEPRQPVWSDPAVLAPAPRAEPFHLSDDLAERVGTDQVNPMDLPTCRAVLRALRPEKELSQAAPESSESESPESHEQPVLAAPGGWAEWVERWRWTPLWRVANHLAEGLETTQRGFEANRHPRRSDQEHAAAARAKRRLRWALWPVAAAAIVLGVVVSERQLGWVHRVTGLDWGEPADSLGDPLFVLFVVACSAGLGLLAGLCRRVIVTAEAFEQADATRRRRRDSAWRFAKELTRLHSLSVQFDDHQQVIRTMLHEPFGSGIGRHDDLDADRLSDLKPSAFMRVGTAAVDRDRLAEAWREEAARAIGPGWISHAHNEALRLWSRDFAQKVNTAFPPPDDDSGPPGVVRYRSAEESEPLPGPREHFRGTVVGDDDLRRNLRVELADIRQVAPISLLGPVRTVSETGVPMDVPTFLHLPDPRSDMFDQSIFGPSAPYGAGRATQVDRPVTRPVVLSDGDHRSETILATWRVSLSNPVGPHHLAGYRPDEGSEPPEQPSGPSVV